MVDAASCTLRPASCGAALGEAAKMAALGDERLFELLEAEGRGDRRRRGTVTTDGAIAEVVERCGWAKVEVVTADEREQDGRINLNLGHSLAHAIEAAAGYEGVPREGRWPTGRAACRNRCRPGGDTARAGRQALLDLGRAPLPWLDAVLAAIVTDKKHAAADACAGSCRRRPA